MLHGHQRHRTVEFAQLVGVFLAQPHRAAQDLDELFLRRLHGLLRAFTFLAVQGFEFFGFEHAWPRRLAQLDLAGEGSTRTLSHRVDQTLGQTVHFSIAWPTESTKTLLACRERGMQGAGSRQCAIRVGKVIERSTVREAPPSTSSRARL